MAEFSYINVNPDTADTDVYTTSSASFGDADADRYIIVGIVARKAGASTTISSVTIGGVSATIIRQFSNSDTNSDIAGLAIANVPTGTSGDIVVTFSDTMVRASTSWWRAIGYDFSATTDDDSDGSADPSVTLNVTDGGILVAVSLSNSQTTCSWTNATERYDGTLETYITYTGADIASTTASSVTVTADYASSGTIPVLVGASWALSASAEDLSIDVSDSISITEFVGYFKDLVSILEYISIEQTTQSEWNINVGEDIGIEENIETDGLSFIEVNEEQTITEDISIDNNLLGNIDVNDEINAVESVILDGTLFVSVNSTLTLSEDLNAVNQELGNIDVFEEQSISELVSIGSTISLSVEDSVEITEEITISETNLGGVDVYDEISTTESVELEISSKIDIYDEISVSENITINVSTVEDADISVNDDIAIEENIETEVSLFIFTFDEITNDEEITINEINLGGIDVSEEITITEDININTESANDFSISIFSDVSILENTEIQIESLGDINTGDDVSVAEDILISRELEIRKGSGIIGYGVKIIS